MRFTTQKAALCHALLNGRRLTIMDGFKEFGITNLPREIGRSVERSFGVMVRKGKMRYKNMFGEEGTCFIYWLLDDKKSMCMPDKKRCPAHRKGLKLMQKYVNEHTQYERIIYPSKNKSIIGRFPVKDDSHYVKTYPAFTGNELSAYYAREAEKIYFPKTDQLKNKKK